jgi:hypothetical protein
MEVGDGGTKKNKEIGDKKQLKIEVITAGDKTK